MSLIWLMLMWKLLTRQNLIKSAYTMLAQEKVTETVLTATCLIFLLFFLDMHARQIILHSFHQEHCYDIQPEDMYVRITLIFDLRMLGVSWHPWAWVCISGAIYQWSRQPTWWVQVGRSLLGLQVCNCVVFLLYLAYCYISLWGLSTCRIWIEGL